MSSRVGIGYDSHRFGADRPLLLGGVEVPHGRGLTGHSDADVVIHAVIDALLGASGGGDIGTHFPPSEERWRDARRAARAAGQGVLVVIAGRAAAGQPHRRPVRFVEPVLGRLRELPAQDRVLHRACTGSAGWTLSVFAMGSVLPRRRFGSGWLRT